MAGKRLCVGMLAHVDSGKTTLSEAMLYRAGAVQHGLRQGGLARVHVGQHPYAQPFPRHFLTSAL